MSTGNDDESLSWAGDDPTPAAASPAPTNTTDDPALPSGFRAVGKGSKTVGKIEADGTITPAPRAGALSNAGLIALGILGGVYLLYTVGWIIGGLRLKTAAVSTFLVSTGLFVPAFIIALLAPLIWFGTTYLVTLRSAPWAKYLWFVIGLVLLVPWPFVLIGTIGQS